MGQHNISKESAEFARKIIILRYACYTNCIIVYLPPPPSLLP